MRNYFLIVMFLITGCSSMSLEKCQNANWQVYGEKDAMAGSEDNYSDWANKCQEFSVVPDKASYESGYKMGLIKFCSFQNGYIFGNQGKPLPQTCPIETQEAFTKGYIEGKRSYDQKDALDKQTKIMEDNRQEELNYRERVLGTIQGMSCHEDHDCKKMDKCNWNNKCEKSGKSCSYQNDCNIVGSCVHHKCSF